MKKQCSLILSITTIAHIAIGGIICSGNSALVAIDSRMGVRESDGNETLTYSSLWNGNASATVTIAQDGVALVEGLAGEGERFWSVPAGTYELTHTTYANGVARKIESATFKVIKELTSTMVASIADVTYTGSALTPSPVVTDSARGATLVNGTDYTLSYVNNVNAGTATVTITGKGNYTGSIRKTFTIAKATYDMSGVAWSYSSPFTYDGRSHSVTLGGLPSGVSVANYGNNFMTAAGSYTATATLSYDSANYETPTAPSCAWSIARRNISDATIALGGALTYNGELQTQLISSVTVGGLTVTYSTSGNTANAPGTYTLTVTGTGNFTGTATKQYIIARKNISGATVVLGDSLIYTGAVQSQNVSSVTVDGLNVTFDVSGNSATAAGMYTLTVTGTGNFTGTATKTFTVAKATYDMSRAKWDYSSPFTYDGNAHSVTLSDLPSGVSVASYANNSKTEAGDYTATAKLNYDSANYNAPTSPSCTWTIDKAVVESPIILSNVFDGSECLAVVEPNALYSVVGNVCDLTTGVYEVELALTDPSNYSWRDADGTVLLLTGQVVNLVIADGVTEIGIDAFSGWTELRTVDIPDGVTRIGPGAFADCSSLKHITIPDSVINIGDGAFDGCTGLVSVTLPLPEESNPPEPGFYEAKFTGLGSLDGDIGIIDNAREIKVSAEKLYANIDEYVMYAYGAYMYLQGGVRYWFSACYDNFVTIKLDENLLISPHDWYYGDQTASASFQSSGWHWIELRVYNSNDVGGPSGNGVYWWTNENTARHSFADPGDCSLFVTKQPPKEATLREIFPNSFDKLVSVTLTGGAKSIPKGFFSGCAMLTSVTLPDGVTRIGPGAFDGCTSLASLDMPNTLTDWGLDSLPPAMSTSLAVYDANGFCIVDGWLLDYQNKIVSSLVVPEGVVGIGSCALAQMYDLETVNLPQSLKYIAEGAFREDTYLDNLVIPDGVEIIGDRAFEDCSFIQTMTLGSGIKSVGARAFAGCTQLSGVTFGEGLVEIGAGVFDGCWRMLSVSLPLSVTNVASTAFNGCTSLTGVTVPTHGGKMSEWFAPVYSQIRDVTVPEGEVEVRASMFEGCGSLQTVQMPDSITNIAARAFYGCSSLPEVRLPESLMAVGGETFRNCSSLTAAALPESVTCIGARAFQGCSNLSALTLPRGLEALPDYVFADCWSLDSFVVPAAVTNLGNCIVSGSTTAIYYLGDAPAYGANVYGNASGSLKSYVILGTKGWDGRPNSRDIPASWNGRDILTWSANQFDVTFDANGGLFFPVVTNTYACEEITYTGYSLPPFEPVRKGMDFDGYWTEPNGGTRVFTSTQVLLTKPHTLYSHWKKGATIKVRFNACGGTVLPVEDDYVAERPYCELPVPVREHFVFDGWWTEANGGSRVEISSEAPKAAHELFAHWMPASHKIRFHANNGTDASVDQYFTYGDTVTLRANSFGYGDKIFVGWALSEDGPAVYADGKTLTDVAAIQDNVIHLYAVWVSTRYTVRFDSHGGVGRMENQTLVKDTAAALYGCAFTRTGYTFAGWAVSTTGVVVYGDGERVVNVYEKTGANVVLYAVWEPIIYSIHYSANGGIGTMADQSMTYDKSVRLAAVSFVKDGAVFKGWSTAENGAMVYPDGVSVKNLASIDGAVVTLYAVWLEEGAPWPLPKPEPVLEPELYDEDEIVGAVPATASVYDGYLVDASGNVAGTIQVKVGKANAKTGLAAVKATVVGLDGKKKSLKGADKGKVAIAVDGPTTIRLVGGEPCEVTLGAEGLSGTYGSYFIDGARNFFTSKDKGEQNAANAILSKLLGAVNVVWDGGTISVAIGKKGKAKVYVTLANGTKAMVNTQMLIGEEWLCVPVVVTKKMNLAFTLWLPVGGGAAVVEGLPGDVVVGKAGALKAGAKFHIDAEEFSARWGQRALPYLPDGVAVTANGTRWTLPKAGKVQMAKDGTVDEAKLGGNPAALKLTYKAKDGSFKGSFKAYSLVNGKPKAVTVNVAGVVVDGVGYGTATVKKVGSVPISIE